MNTAAFQFLNQRITASRALEVVKLKAFVPCVVENQFKTYKSKIVELVYDPLRVEEVNARFAAEGYDLSDDDVHVIAVNEDGSILLWGGLNSVFHLRKGEKIVHCLDIKHIAFQDVLDLTGPFKIKNKKVEIDELISKLRQKYTSK